MTAERWRQVKSAFDYVVEGDPELRPQLLRERCGSDEALLCEVESLLRCDEAEIQSPLDNPIVKGGGLAAVAPPVVPDPIVGRSIGNYIVTGELAHGGMGTVYRARHVSLPRNAVVKCIRLRSFSAEFQEELRARFRQEAHIQCQMDHRNIVRVYEFFAGAEEYFLVMEYVQGSNIRSLLDRKKRLPAAEVIALAMQALEGLSHAHTLNYVDEAGNTGVGIIHRDIKPANLLVDEDQNLKLTDFGIAKAVRGIGRTKFGSSPGTMEYMSPEQVRGLPLDARSDLYSLGVTLYEMLSGRVPFSRPADGSEYDVLIGHVDRIPPPLGDPDIPAGLAQAVMRSLQKDPDQRWQTAGEFREHLLAGASPQSGSAEILEKHPRRRFVVMAVSALALTLSAAALWLHRGPKPAALPSSIAVLPFADASPGKDQDYFAEGLSEELLNGLARIPGLRVTGRTSSFRFKGQTGDFRKIARELHVDSILEGSVRSQGNRVRITVQLIQAADGFQLWSEIYNRELNDIFAVQDEITSAITTALRVQLLGEKKAVLSAKNTGVPWAAITPESFADPSPKAEGKNPKPRLNTTFVYPSSYLLDTTLAQLHGERPIGLQTFSS